MEDIQIGDQQHHVINFMDIGDRTHAWLDKSLIYSILSNLLSNAIKYSHEGGNIEFILDGHIDCVTFKVKDQGIGIVPEVQSTLFEPFHRGKNVGSISGTGLGLTLVKRCLDLHQGQIIVESKVNLGITFTVQIPQNISTQNALYQLIDGRESFN